MSAAIQRLRRRHRDDTGYTLTELLVSMAIFAVLLALVATATTMMFNSFRRQSGQTDNLDNSRKVISLLDKQVRYANAVNTPATGTDSNFYVEFRVGNTNQQQTCYQWRYNVSGKSLQYRTWQPFLTTGVGTPTATSWVTVGNGVGKSGTTPVFSITPPTGATTPSHEYLTITFTSTHGKPSKTTTSQVSLTAQNTSSSTAPASPLCNEHGEPNP